MATWCDIEGCDKLSFRTDKNTRKHYCGNHWRQHSTDIDKRSITAKALARGKVEKIQKPPRFIRPGTFDESFLNSSIIPVTPTPECYDGKESGRYIMDEVWVTSPCGNGNIGMDAFWKYAESVIIKTGCVCWNCGDSISKNDFHNSTAHIFPKSIFLSISSHPLNFIVAGNRCGCHNLTHTMLKFSQMSVFATAVNRYMKFCHLITENHKYHDLFLDYANAII